MHTSTKPVSDARVSVRQEPSEVREPSRFVTFHLSGSADPARVDPENIIAFYPRGKKMKGSTLVVSGLENPLPVEETVEQIDNIIDEHNAKWREFSAVGEEE